MEKRKVLHNFPSTFVLENNKCYKCKETENRIITKPFNLSEIPLLIPFLII